MTTGEQPLTTTTADDVSQSGGWLGWNRLGIRQKILIPIIFLTIFSSIGSAILFLYSTNTTRNSILERQISEESERLQAAMQLRFDEAREAAQNLSDDPGLLEPMQDEELRDVNRSPDIAARTQTIKERYGLDQMIVLNTAGEARSNIAPPELEEITVRQPDLLEACDQSTTQLGTFEDRIPLLIVCEPIYSDGQSLGQVYAILDLNRQISDAARRLELGGIVTVDGIEPAATAPLPPQQSFDAATETLRQSEGFVLGGGRINITNELSAQGISEVVGAGLRTTLLASLLTVVLLAGLGWWLSTGFTRPILKLVSVAEAVAEGDLSPRANLTHQDEIGRLGQAFDQATGQISHLLDQQARTAGERQAILQSIADGVLAVDIHERIVVLNPAAAELLGQDADEMLGKRLSELRMPDDPSTVVGLQQIIQQVRRELMDEDFAPTEDQIALGRRIVRLRSAPTMQRGTVLTGAVVSMQDVTRAVELDRAKSEFIATASHELRTPLASLRGFVDVFLLTGTDNLNENQRLYLDTIKRQTNNLTQLVNDLLEIARLDRGEERLERRWIAPASAIEEILNSQSDIIVRREVQVSTDLQPDLPMVWLDNLHLRIVLSNLIGNAIKYVYQGGMVFIRAHTITSSEQLPTPPFNHDWNHSNEDSLLVVVEDNGVGIRAEDQPRIFERFFRSENPLSVEVGGTGLGLAITYSLIELNECQIGFRSSEGQGSLFWLRIPTASTELLDNPSHPEGTYQNGVGTVVKNQEA